DRALGLGFLDRDGSDRLLESLGAELRPQLGRRFDQGARNLDTWHRATLRPAFAIPSLARAACQPGIVGSFAGSTTRSIAVIRPPSIAKPTTLIGFGPGPTMTPAAPLTMAWRASGAKRDPRA